ncbi:hypothetical protein CfE428DRAFT_4226 [Chthoniobacter flavus Ellin428]|uniref:Uncharacterized protein n=1 Tax=Chthoniobacter flavus Ellin428 TaxID=497964 RepID=B4D5N7_9BACT|nr:hypothetical protein [Chthoniobacter flavus]EDY18442.1 hypothetical protein CfE428DRAFT_4226 [Chthoniobacter flavus Ellin428]TCO81365.1 hypothetical protein EV701_1623 [Chthoniobacter flavus]
MTVAELLASESFALLFHHEYCEQAMRQLRSYAYPLGDPDFTAENVDGSEIRGRFLAQAELEEGPHGATSGTFLLTIPAGWDAGDVQAILENATLNVQIETAPAGPANAIRVRS